MNTLLRAVAGVVCCAGFAFSTAPLPAHTLPEEGATHVTSDICENGAVRTAAPITTPDLKVSVDGGRPLVILVPGTGSEDGCAKQFRSIIRRLKDGDNVVSLNYHKDTVAEDIGLTDFTSKNRRRYDWSVDLGVQALEKLLAGSHADRILVFGHSKGAHIVAQVARNVENRPDSDHIRFWSFAQPQRVSWNKNNKHGSGALGKRGYIVKSANNLVTVNWHNDEVWYINGTMGVANAWRYPGEVNEPGAPAGLHMNRFDHHNNYGGHYTELSCPYYPTGDDARYNDPDENTQRRMACNHRTVEFHPYFWGDPQCFSLAMAAQAKDSFQHYIGTSGPRGVDCRPLASMPVDIQVRFRHRYASGNGKGFSIRFRDFNRFEADGSAVIAVIKGLGSDRKSKQWTDTPWHTLMLPNSFIFQVDPLSKGARNARNNIVDIAWVKARFADPRDPSRTLYRYIVRPQCAGPSGGFPCHDRGLTPFEGQDQVIGSLEGNKASGWNKFRYRDVENKMTKDTSNWHVKKATALQDGQLREVLRFSGDANGHTAGFYKFYSLMD